MGIIWRSISRRHRICRFRRRCHRMGLHRFARNAGRMESRFRDGRRLFRQRLHRRGSGRGSQFHRITGSVLARVCAYKCNSCNGLDFPHCFTGALSLCIFARKSFTCNGLACSTVSQTRKPTNSISTISPLTGLMSYACAVKGRCNLTLESANAEGS